MNTRTTYFRPTFCKQQCCSGLPRDRLRNDALALPRLFPLPRMPSPAPPNPQPSEKLPRKVSANKTKLLFSQLSQRILKLFFFSFIIL